MEDKYLTVVEEHVERLGEMAKNINEELQIQDRMVDDLGHRIDVANEHVVNVNTRMKVSAALLPHQTKKRGTHLFMFLNSLLVVLLFSLLRGLLWVNV